MNDWPSCRHRASRSPHEREADGVDDRRDVSGAERRCGSSGGGGGGGGERLVVGVERVSDDRMCLDAIDEDWQSGEAYIQGDHCLRLMNDAVIQPKKSIKIQDWRMSGCLA